ncbi:MAG TPA: hypothetical protein VGM81_24665 [Burkholderiaceae bacterium]
MLLFSLVVSANVAAAATEASQRKPVYLGTFSQVGYSRGSGDCGGFDAQLWVMKEPGSQPKVYGFIDSFEGPCDPAEMQIMDGSFDERTGVLKFVAAGVVRPANLKVRFEGRLSARSLSGRLFYANYKTGQFGDDAGSSLKLPRVNGLRRPHW